MQRPGEKGSTRNRGQVLRSCFMLRLQSERLLKNRGWGPAPLRGRFFGVIPGEPAWEAAGYDASLDASLLAREADPCKKPTPERYAVWGPASAPLLLAPS